MIHLCENSVSEVSAKLLVRERLRDYSQHVSSSVFAAKWRCSSGTGVPTGESCRVCENFATWLNVEKYLSTVTALRVKPARAVIGASSIAHTPQLLSVSFAFHCSAGVTQARAVSTSPLDFLLKSAFYSVLFGRRAAPWMPVSPGVASIRLLPTAEVQSAGLSETLLLSLSPRSCRTLAPASQLSTRLTHFWDSR